MEKNDVKHLEVYGEKYYELDWDKVDTVKDMVSALRAGGVIVHLPESKLTEESEYLFKPLMGIQS